MSSEPRCPLCGEWMGLGKLYHRKYCEGKMGSPTREEALSEMAKEMNEFGVKWNEWKRGMIFSPVDGKPFRVYIRRRDGQVEKHLSCFVDWAGKYTEPGSEHEIVAWRRAEPMPTLQFCEEDPVYDPRLGRRAGDEPAKDRIGSAAQRKAAPVVSGFIDYFPDAIVEVARLSKIGNDQHNPGQDLHWSRGKSNDHVDCEVRHLIDRGKFDSDGVRHSTKRAWRAMADLQLELETDLGLPLPRGARE